jgi:hypothetical protein
MLVLAMQFSRGVFGQAKPGPERNNALAVRRGRDGAPLQNGTEDGTILECDPLGGNIDLRPVNYPEDPTS